MKRARSTKAGRRARESANLRLFGPLFVGDEAPGVGTRILSEISWWDDPEHESVSWERIDSFVCRRSERRLWAVLERTSAVHPVMDDTASCTDSDVVRFSVISAYEAESSIRIETNDGSEADVGLIHLSCIVRVHVVGAFQSERKKIS